LSIDNVLAWPLKRNETLVFVAADVIWAGERFDMRRD
jgi:hypothetical protein